VEYDETNLAVVVVFIGDKRDGRKSPPKVRRKPSFSKLRRPIYGATNSDSENRPYFWNQRVESYAGIYILLRFGNFLEFLNFRIYFLFNDNFRKS
jgi:hypothetical protein